MSVPPRLAILGSTVTALAVARNAAHLGMRPVLLDTEAGVAAGTRRAQIRLFPGHAPQALLPVLQEIAAEGPAWLIATSDAWLRFVVEHRFALERAFADVLHPDNATLAICLSKAEFSRWCAREGLPTARAFHRAELLDGADRLPYPLLLRPQESRHQSGGTVPKAVEARDPAELRRWLATYDAAGATPLVTESLLGRRIVQYSVGAARRGAATLSFTAIKRRPLPERCSVGTFVEISADAAVDALARRALDALAYHGIAEVEILRDEDSGRDVLIEVNARPWVQYALAPASGHDLLGFLINPGAPARAAKRGGRWLNLSGDVYGCFSRSLGIVRSGRLSFPAWLGSVLRADTYAHFSWTDPGPAWLELRRFLAAWSRARRR
jgi:predicted ATP-grasp superfamily ATP-dependent carboligase